MSRRPRTLQMAPLLWLVLSSSLVAHLVCALPVSEIATGVVVSSSVDSNGTHHSVRYLSPDEVKDMFQQGPFPNFFPTPQTSAASTAFVPPFFFMPAFFQQLFAGIPFFYPTFRHYVV